MPRISTTREDEEASVSGIGRESGEWRMENAEWRMQNAECRMRNGGGKAGEPGGPVPGSV
ncbi:MAG: hypothetical protein D6755_00840 [Anaerolineae bacterium]|nr:MAG: hypothetical protein D6755_00840 [Anaerolineae bacterium]